jgi:tripartite-type tricarboxylate transporter receptor subunit TctC
MRNFLSVAAITTALAIAAEASAQTFPSRPITMVVPFAAGGGQDVLARLLAPYMSETLKQPVIVENITGAGGMTGSARIARAAPDGYQLVIGGTGTHAVNQTFYKRPLYNAAIDFAPVALIAEVPLALVVRTDLPINDLPQFTRYAQVGHAKMQYGSSGTGSSSHLTCVLLNAAIGVNVTHIPYRGAAPAIRELIAGRIDYGCSVLDSALPSIEGKLIRPVAVLSRFARHRYRISQAHTNRGLPTSTPIIGMRFFCRVAHRGQSFGSFTTPRPRRWTILPYDSGWRNLD